MNTNNKTTEPTQQKPLRLWPGVVIVILQWLIRFVIPVFIPGAIAFGIFGGLLLGLAVVVWWVFFSRAPRFERWFAVVLMIAALAATSQIIHKSIATAMMGMMFTVYSIPVLSLAFVVWAVASRRLSGAPRRATMVAVILLASGFWALLRTDGMDGESHQDFAWRWAKTPEERLLEKAGDKLVTMTSGFSSNGKRSRMAGLSGDLTGMALSTVCGLRPIGLNRLLLRCGAGLSDRAAPPLQFMVLYSIPRNSGVNTKWLPATI